MPPVRMGEEDPRERLFYACADQRMPILDLHLDETSLEQVFLRLTSDAAVEPPARKRRKLGRNRSTPVEEGSVAVAPIPVEPSGPENQEEVSDQ